jgi:hypothetical protein
MKIGEKFTLLDMHWVVKRVRDIAVGDILYFPLTTLSVDVVQKVEHTGKNYLISCRRNTIKDFGLMKVLVKEV